MMLIKLACGIKLIIKNLFKRLIIPLLELFSLVSGKSSEGDTKILLIYSLAIASVILSIKFLLAINIIII